MRININENNLRANFTIANIAFAEVKRKPERKKFRPVQELHPELVQCSTNEVCPDCALLKSCSRECQKVANKNCQKSQKLLPKFIDIFK